MRTLSDFRSGKPAFYPDQTVYAEYACAEFGLRFADIDGGSGLLFTVASASKTIHFGAGRCSWYPQNNATASTLASDKYFTDRILERAGLPSLGGEYFFLHERHRAHRPTGHERSDALEYLNRLGGTAFVKPLQGSRGDFAQIVDSGASLLQYLDEVSKHYDSVLIQRVFSGLEYRIFVLDDDVLYTARKFPPVVVGDGVRSLRSLISTYNQSLQSRGLSPAPLQLDASHDTVLAEGARFEIPGRKNLSAGGTMGLENLDFEPALRLATSAVRSLGLRIAAVDLFMQPSGEAGSMRIIEINSNPSIRLLEDSSRGDLILKIWHHTFASQGLL